MREQAKMIQELRDPVGKNSRNTGKSPSRDGLKQQRTHSLRGKSGRQRGEQVGHEGHTLRRVAAPDLREQDALEVYLRCAKDLRQVAKGGVEKRQLFGMPRPQLGVTEYLAEVAHFNESGVSFVGKRFCLPVASTARLTYDPLPPKPGPIGMQVVGILPAFRRRAVYDFWAAYLTFQAGSHTFCNAHHLRELRFIAEPYPQAWADPRVCLLLDINSEVIPSPPPQTALLPDRLAHFEPRFDALSQQGLAANPPSDPPLAPQKGRKKQSRPQNLLGRLRFLKPQLLAFMFDFRFPFDNNLAEHAVRMVKVKQKKSLALSVSSPGQRLLCPSCFYLGRSQTRLPCLSGYF